MKKLFLLSGLLLTAATLHAQRLTDISVTMLTPSAGDTLYEGIQFQVSYEMTNNGPDIIKANQDTIIRAFTFNNDVIGTPTGIILSSDLLPDSTITRTVIFTFTSVPQEMQGDFCVYIGIQNRGQDSARDVNQTNNLGCAQVSLKKSSPNRVADMSVALQSPVNGDTIYSKVNFQISMIITNHGPDLMRAGVDTINISLTLNAQPVGAFFYRLANDLLPDSSIILNFPPTSIDFDEGFHGPGNLCFIISHKQKVAHLVVDNNPNNDTACVAVILEEEPVSVGKINKLATEIKAYPNPASHVLNVSFKLEKPEPVTIILFDLQGREITNRVVEETNGFSGGVFKGELDVSDVSNGIYFLEIKVGQYSTVEKIIVNR